MIDAVLIQPAGDIYPITINDWRDVQTAVGGTFDCIGCDGADFWIHDEGKIIGLPMNRKATQWLWTLNPRFVGQDIICGPALVTGPPDEEGNSTSISDELKSRILNRR